MKQIAFGDIQVEVVKKNIKNLHLAVYPPQGRVRLAAPEGVNDETLRLFTLSKLPWIRRQQRLFRNQERQPERQYIARETHYFMGRRYLLRVVETDGTARVAIKHHKYIELYIKPGSTLAQRHRLLTEWYRAELKKRAQTLFEKWTVRMGVTVAHWGVQQMKTKWGTCNPETQRILLNLELAKKPPACIEYIVVHELVHLLERRHNDRFMAYMQQYLPRWKQLREELNRLPVSHAEWGY
ncbi:MAG: M48 family metallopeptidase [Dinghuibacter sp.]|nr:M48 family metallopeptidase [Dinghuibacter sp.]